MATENVTTVDYAMRLSKLGYRLFREVGKPDQFAIYSMHSESIVEPGIRSAADLEEIVAEIEGEQLEAQAS